MYVKLAVSFGHCVIEEGLIQSPFSFENVDLSRASVKIYIEFTHLHTSVRWPSDRTQRQRHFVARIYELADFVQYVRFRFFDHTRFLKTYTRLISYVPFKLRGVFVEHIPCDYFGKTKKYCWLRKVFLDRNCRSWLEICNLFLAWNEFVNSLRRIVDKNSARFIHRTLTFQK